MTRVIILLVLVFGVALSCAAPSTNRRGGDQDGDSSGPNQPDANADISAASGPQTIMGTNLDGTLSYEHAEIDCKVSPNTAKAFHLVQCDAINQKDGVVERVRKLGKDMAISWAAPQVQLIVGGKFVFADPSKTASCKNSDDGKLAWSCEVPIGGNVEANEISLRVEMALSAPSKPVKEVSGAATYRRYLWDETPRLIVNGKSKGFIHHRTPVVASNARGDFVMVAMRNNGATYDSIAPFNTEIVVKRYLLGRWQSEDIVAATDYTQSVNTYAAVSAAIDKAGNVMVAWAGHFAGAGQSSNSNSIFARYFDVSTSTWGAERQFTGEITEGRVGLAMNGDGEAVLSYATTPPNVPAVQYIHHWRHGSWSRAVTLKGSSGLATVVIAENGDAVCFGASGDIDYRIWTYTTKSQIWDNGIPVGISWWSHLVSYNNDQMALFYRTGNGDLMKALRYSSKTGWEGVDAGIVVTGDASSFHQTDLASNGNGKSLIVYHAGDNAYAIDVDLTSGSVSKPEVLGSFPANSCTNDSLKAAVNSAGDAIVITTECKTGTDYTYYVNSRVESGRWVGTAQLGPRINFGYWSDYSTVPVLLNRSEAFFITIAGETTADTSTIYPGIHVIQGRR